MKYISDWIQGLSAIAIVVGLILVVIELRQAEQIAQAQIWGESNSATMQIYETVMGEESAESLSKACFNPDELNNKDLVVLDQLFNLWWLKAARHLLLTSYGELHPMENAEWIAGNFIRQITGTAHGRWWWEQRSNSPRMESLGERVIRENPYDCAEYMSAFKSLDGSRPTTRD